MKSKLSNITIGVLPGYQAFEGNLLSYHLEKIIKGIMSAADEMSCNLLIGCGMSTTPLPSSSMPAWPYPDKTATFVPIGPWNTDGIIVIPPLSSKRRSKQIQDLIAKDFPVVFASAGERGPQIVTDNSIGIHEAVAHLRDHGHRRIAYIAGYENRTGDTLLRRSSFEAAMKNYSLDFDPNLISYGKHTIEQSKDAMQDLLSTALPFSAIITSNFHTAIGAYETLKLNGLQVPEDMALICFDDPPEAKAQTPPFTAIHQRTYEIGYKATLLLLDHILGEKHERSTIQIPEQLIIRESCGCSPDIKTRITIQTKASPNDIVNLMVAETLPEIFGIQENELKNIFQQQIKAFQESVTSRDTAPFFANLNNLIQFWDNKQEKLHVFLPTFSLLRKALANLVNEQDLDFAKDQIDQARILLETQAQQQDAKIFSRQALISQNMGKMTGELLRIHEKTEIQQVLDTYLPQMGFNDWGIIIFSSSKQDPFAMSHAWITKHAVAPQEFETQKFSPSFLYQDDDTNFQLALFPLVIREDTQEGYMFFSTNSLAYCATIVRAVSASILHCELYQEALRARQLAEEANRLKTTFLSVVSHELRTPLNLIVGLSELIMRERKQGKEIKEEDLECIYLNSKHLGYLIRDVLDLTGHHTGQLQITMESLDLVEDILSYAAAIGDHMAKEKGLRWEQSFPEGAVKILGDRTRLRQVTINLITNAVKFTEVGKVSLSAVVQDEVVKVSIHDTGIGVKEEDRSHIFNEFQQSKVTSSRGYGGLGLGLAISKSLIELHGGTIDVNSKGIDGDGATFYYLVPLLKEIHSPSTLVENTVGQTHETIRQLMMRIKESETLPQIILLVDDDRETLQLYARLIHEQLPDGRVLQAFDGKQALDILNSIRPDFVILDLHMPEADGFSVLEAMRKDNRLKDIPVLIVSGQYLSETEMASFDHDVVGVLGKGVFSTEEAIDRMTATINNNTKVSQTTQQLVRRAMAYIHDQYAETITRKMLANYLSVNDNYLTNCFQRELAMSPITYLNRYRIEQARKLLETSQYTITEIAQMVGYGNSAYFSRIFQREVGVSPLAYRRGEVAE